MIVDWAGGLAHLQSLMNNLAAGLWDDQASDHRISMTMHHLGSMRPHRTTVADELTKHLISLGNQG